MSNLLPHPDKPPLAFQYESVFGSDRSEIDRFSDVEKTAAELARFISDGLERAGIDERALEETPEVVARFQRPGSTPADLSLPDAVTYRLNSHPGFDMDEFELEMHNNFSGTTSLSVVAHYETYSGIEDDDELEKVIDRVELYFRDEQGSVVVATSADEESDPELVKRFYATAEKIKLQIADYEPVG